MQMNLSTLRCFIETVRCGTMTEAAKQLYMAQPNLSRQITHLEEAVGVQLFFREHRSLQLTPAGSYLYEKIKDIPDSLERAFEQAAQLANQTKTIINIGVQEGQLPYNLFSDRLEEFQETHPNVAINIENRDFEALKNGLKNRVYDFIITLQFVVSGMPDIQTRVLLRQPAALAVPRSDPLAQRESLSISDLEGRSIIALDPQKSQEAYLTLCRRFSEAGVSLTCARFANSTDQLLLLVETGAGIAVEDTNNRLAYSPNVRLYPLLKGSDDPEVCIAHQTGALQPMQQTLLDMIAPLENNE